MSKEQETKLCKHCKVEIPKNAKVCPNCNKKQGGVLKWVIIAVLVIGIGGAMAQNDPSDENANIESTVESSPEPTVAPTPEPTADPSPAPTADPTPEPTEAPSPAPTVNPASEPTEAPAADPIDEVPAPGDNDNYTYVLNTSTQKIHHPNCNSVPKIKPENYATTDKSIDELLNEGYTKCGNCW